MNLINNLEIDLSEYRQQELPSEILLSRIDDLYRLYNGSKTITSEILLINTNLYNKIIVKLDIDFEMNKEQKLDIQIKTDEIDNNLDFFFEIKMKYYCNDQVDINNKQQIVSNRLDIPINNNNKILFS